MPRWPFAFMALLHMGALYWMADQPPDLASRMAPGPLGNLLHVPMNFILATFVLRAVSPRAPLFGRRSWQGLRSRAGRICLVVVTAHGVLDETHQFFVGRTCSVFDVAMDASGALLLLLAPLPGVETRPATWKPFLTVLLASVSIGVLGWLGRPWPDRVLEQLLQSFT